MKILLLAFLATQANLAFSQNGNISATISARKEEARTIYKVSVSNKDASQRIILAKFGESCSLGKLIDHDRFDFDHVPIENNQGHYKTKVVNSPDVFQVETDGYLKISSIEGTSAVEEKLFINENETKVIEFHTTKNSNNLMLDLPLCLEAVGGSKKEIEVLVSEENWIDSDLTFDIENSINACKQTFPGVLVDINQGDQRAQCHNVKYEYLVARPSLQFACILEKRLQNRLINLEKNKILQEIRTRIAAQPSKPKLQDNYNKRLEALKANLLKAIENQKREIENAKAKSDNLTAKIAKTCKQ